MNIRVFKYCLFFFLVLPRLSSGIEAFESDKKLIINHPRKSYILNLPSKIEKSASYSIIIHPHERYKFSDFDDDEHYEATEDVNLLVFKANELFQQRDYTAAMKILIKAHKQAPHSTRVNNMIGSIFYALEDYEMARKYWTQSLAVNANQPQVEKYLNKLPRPTYRE